MEFKNILLSVENEIGILTINRPKALNALNMETLKEIQMGIQEVKDHPAVKVLIITGAGEKAFVAGADIQEMKGMNSIEALNFSKLGHRHDEDDSGPGSAGHCSGQWVCPGRRDGNRPGLRFHLCL